MDKLVLTLDHYLDVLARKPGALPGSLPLAQARTSGVFTATHEAWWTAVRAAAASDADAVAAMVAVLLLHRQLPHDAVLTGIRAALAIGSTNPDIVAVQARHAAAAPGVGAVLALPERIGPDTRPTPNLSAYDDLLTDPDNPPEPEAGKALP